MIELQLQILNFIQTYIRHPILDHIMRFITSLGNFGIIWLMIGIILIMKKHYKSAFILFLALMIGVMICNGLLKNLFQMPRPFEFNSSIELLIPKPLDYSFPSGHTGSSFAAFYVLFLRKEKSWQFSLVFAILMAFSRMYLYVHFPMDIIGGIIVGMLSAKLSVYLFNFLCQKRFLND